MGAVGNGAAEEDWHWDLNLGIAAVGTEDHTVLKKRKEDYVVWGEKGEDHAALAK